MCHRRVQRETNVLCLIFFFELLQILYVRGTSIGTAAAHAERRPAPTVAAAVAASIPRSLRKSTLVTSNVLPTMSAGCGKERVAGFHV